MDRHIRVDPVSLTNGRTYIFSLGPRLPKNLMVTSKDLDSFCRDFDLELVDGPRFEDFFRGIGGGCRRADEVRYCSPGQEGK